MFAAVLLITGIHTTIGFNIIPSPVFKYTNSNDKLFGQTIIQSKDGVFVPSPNFGDVYSCTQNNCLSMNIAEGAIKGLRPITSLTSNLNAETEQLLVCNQVRTVNFSTEYFNGHCAHVSNGKKEYIQPAEILSKQMEQKRTRKRREADTAEDTDDEDAGTEIAFVLDGSGSIEPDDFKIAKQFIHRVMEKVWEACFSCNFGIVQFGKHIRTELYLNENNNATQALEKVNDIKQIGRLTATASALYHVLTDIFIPENGSKNNSRKIIILLSDGIMAGDNRSLSDVLSMPEMNGITKFAVGVGKEVTGKKATDQMVEIAGSKSRFFSVTEYKALESILSTLEQKIVEIEGTKVGAGFQLQLAEAGFSSHFTHEGSMLFGVVGAYDWSGGIMLKKKNDEIVQFFNATKEKPGFSYLGYSLASATVATKSLYISGAPRYNLTGAVFIFDGNDKDLLEGDQVGSYFGSVLCTLDIDTNGETDYLLVGAPHFHEKGEEGKVLVYKLNQGKFEKQDYELRGLQKHIYARFGSAIADLGDIDGNNYRDIAVGAPLEKTDDSSDNLGVVYIFNGFSTSINQQHSQRFGASGSGIKLVHFGQAISIMSKPSEERLICVGSESNIFVFKASSVIVINPEITITGDIPIPIAMQTADITKSPSIHPKSDLKIQICFETPRRKIETEEIQINYHLDLDYEKEDKDKRLFLNNAEKESVIKISPHENCIKPIDLTYKGCHDCFSPIRIRVDFSLPTESHGYILDAYTPTYAVKEISFEKECRVKDNCKSNISLANAELSNQEIIIGSSQNLNITFDLKNNGDNSYGTTLSLTYPEILFVKKYDGGVCEVKNDENNQIICKILHPVFKRDTQHTVYFIWQPKDKSNVSEAKITANLTGGSNGSEILGTETYYFTVKKIISVQLYGTVIPNRLDITEGEEKKVEKKLQFTFTLMGENKYNAVINLNITFTTTQKLIIQSVEPKGCAAHGRKGLINKQIACTLTELQEITIIVHPEIQKDNTDKITATAKLSFDEDIYTGKDIIKTNTVDVSIIKLTVVKHTEYIVAGCIGGIILLIIIIVVLFKCGFFRQRQQMEYED